MLIRDRFLDELQALGLNPVHYSTLDAEIGSRFAQLNAEIYLTRIGFVSIHISSSSTPSWAVQKEILGQVNPTSRIGPDTPWFVVLLEGRLEDDKLRSLNYVANGYVITAPAHNTLIKLTPLKVKENSFKLLEGRNLNKSQKILSVQVLAKTLANCSSVQNTAPSDHKLAQFS